MFFGHGTEDAYDEAAVLVLSALGWGEVSDDQLDQSLAFDKSQDAIQLLVRRVAERKPAPYLTGEAWFAGLRFQVDERVLIPRSPIAEWIERGFSPWIRAPQIRRILDLGTGSGCIAIASALKFPAAQVVAVDSSPLALEVAAENARYHGVAERLELVRSDLFDAVTGRFDLILSNPPYVDEVELASMPAEYRHEPVDGLAGGRDGLYLVRRILLEAHELINEHGILVVEVGSSADGLMEEFPRLPFIWLDLARGGENVFVLEASGLPRP